MKTFFSWVGLFLCSLLLLSCEGNDTKISVKDSDDTFEFYAKFDKSKTKRVQNFINTRMAPSSSVTGDHVDITTTLDDRTQFKLEEDPGKVRVTLDKDANTKASYRRIKAMCEGVKRVIAEK